MEHQQNLCYHCGDSCQQDLITVDDRHFCCEGCRQVYLLLNENNLCSYYDFDKNPGIKAKGKFTGNRFAYLDDSTVINKLVQYNSEKQTNVTFHLPQMHCSSCVYLLENLHRINPGIIKSQSNFQRKEVFIAFNPQEISLRKVVELLAFTGYEPEISLNDTGVKKKTNFKRSQIYKIGIAGFCFANIMMLSFPEYFSSGKIEQNGLKETFAWLNLVLSLPVLFYSASGFFISAVKGLKQHFLNIDAPIALAIIVTYARSYYEIITGTGAGYLDSGTGIVFFMLVGRWFQNKTYDSISFDRDYKSYFPLGVSILQNGEEKNIPVTKLKKGDRILVRNEEMVPAEAILRKGNAIIDYSFVNGENTPVEKSPGSLIYAGGKQTGAAIELEVVTEVSQSYITQLWNNEVFHNQKNREQSFIHPWSRYFTLVLLTVAAGTGIYWWVNDISKILPAISAVLIVACPCSLLLTATFTYGNMLRIFGKNELYLKNAGVIESLAKINHIVFDKTGTITQPGLSHLFYEGTPLTDKEQKAVKVLASQSSHPLSKIIAASISETGNGSHITAFREYSGKGVQANVDDIDVTLGSASFINEKSNNPFITYDTGSHVHVVVNNVHMGKYSVNNRYRNGLENVFSNLEKSGYHLSVLSGDNDRELKNMEKLLQPCSEILFHQSPQQKLDFIKQLQQKNRNVLMLGDGLNDAGALKQANVGMAVSDSSLQFTPASDAILSGNKVNKLHQFISYAKDGKKIVTFIFLISILYNITGLSFAVSGNLSPLVAAILMPASSISIVLLTTVLSSMFASRKSL